MNKKTKVALPILVLLMCGFIVFARSEWSGAGIYAVDDVLLDEPAACEADLHFAVIGDYGDAGQSEADVAALVEGWDVEFIVTVGDNNYSKGAASTIDRNIGQYYADYIYPYQGEYGEGANENRFWPALGNHDLETAAGQPYFDYFELPGNERYYDFQRGPVHFFILNSDPREPDGRSPNSIQAQWLQTQMSQSDAVWKLVIMHHPPYSSSFIRWPDREMQWPFAEWGATAVLAGHNHYYERLEVDGMPYFVNGAGGRRRYRFGSARPESRVRYNIDYGAMQVQAAQDCLNFSFSNRENELIDSVIIWQ